MAKVFPQILVYSACEIANESLCSEVFNNITILGYKKEIFSDDV